MLDHTTPQSPEQQQNRPSDLQTCDDLGGHINRLTALLRAVINCGAGDEEDESLLVGIAHDEAEAAKARYDLWANAPRGRA
jgi:hypothetical protein